MAARSGNDGPNRPGTAADASASQTDAQRLRGLLQPTVEEHGLYLESVDIRVAGAQRTVHVVVDLPEDQTGGVSLDTIAEISGPLSDVLDGDPLEAGRSYSLEVSSPGISRPLTEPRHWRRARGRLVRLVLTDGDTLTARLRDVTDDGVTVIPDLPVKKGMKPKKGDPRTLGFDQIRRAKVDVEFTQPDDLPDDPAAEEA